MTATPQSVNCFNLPTRDIPTRKADLATTREVDVFRGRCDRLCEGAIGVGNVAACLTMPQLSVASFTAAALAGHAGGRIDRRGLCSLAGLSAACLAQMSPYARLGLGGELATIGIGLALSSHKMPGFDGWSPWQNIRQRPHATPYTNYVLTDKHLAGGILLLMHQVRVPREVPSTQNMVAAAMIAAVTIGTLMSLATATGFVRLERRILSPAVVASWSFNNLLLTILAEEGLYRGLLQTHVTRCLGHAWAGMACVSALFGLAHFYEKGDKVFGIIATIAGLSYGAAALTTGRIEAAIMMHFGLNLLHLVGFTYPALAK